MRCPDQENLLDFFAGRLRGTELAEIEEHLAGCGSCGGALAVLGQLETSLTVKQGRSPNDTLKRGPAIVDDTSREIAPGVVLGGKYRLGREIGRGATGIVFEAEHVRLTARFAVKLLITRVARSSQAFARFEREARLTSGLQHANVVRLFDFDETPSGRAYVVMEYLDGLDLAAYRERQGRLSFVEVAQLVEQIAAGLHAAHRRGIVHRDLKPPNIIVLKDEAGRPTPKIVDFGLAKMIEGALDVTDQPTLLGTPRYMAPEQVRAAVKEIGPATDQFALAAIAYELLAGEPPFAGESLALLTLQITDSEPRPLSACVPGTPPRWDRALARALAKKPGDRFASVVDFAVALSDANGAKDRSLPLSRRRFIAWSGAVSAAAGALFVLGQRLRRRGDHKPAIATADATKPTQAVRAEEPPAAVSSPSSDDVTPARRPAPPATPVPRSLGRPRKLRPKLEPDADVTGDRVPWIAKGSPPPASAVAKEPSESGPSSDIPANSSTTPAVADPAAKAVDRPRDPVPEHPAPNGFPEPKDTIW